MKQQTFSILFLARKAKMHKSGEVPVYGRITVNGERAEFGLAITVPEQEWDFEKGCATGNSKKAKSVRERLDLIKSRVREHFLEMEKYQEEITAFKLRDRYLGINHSNRTILEVFSEHNEKVKGLKGKDYAPATIKRYDTTKVHLERFMKAKYKRDDMGLNEITAQFVSDFEYYFKVDRNCNNNTAVKYMKNFKKVIRIALANGWMNRDPFANVSYHLEETDMDFLTTDELDRLIAYECKAPRLQQVKDIYVFCCFTGLAFIDVKNLTTDEIQLENGRYWIKKKRQKTDNWCHIPMLDPAVKIMQKYKGNYNCVSKGLVLPVLSNQKMNAYLKEISDLAAIEKNLTTHTARHTFATTVTLANQISMEVVSKMLGHNSLSMTRRYARVVDDLINKDMEKIYSKYQSE